MKPLTCVLIALIFGALVSCTSQARQMETVPSDLFVRSENHIGERVKVVGYLRYRFENRNLFPAKEFERRSTEYCLPILIRNKKTELLKLTEALDDNIVEVQGVIIQIAPPGMAAVFACKQVGIEVDTIHKLD